MGEREKKRKGKEKKRKERKGKERKGKERKGKEEKKKKKKEKEKENTYYENFTSLYSRGGAFLKKRVATPSDTVPSIGFSCTLYRTKKVSTLYNSRSLCQVEYALQKLQTFVER